MFIMLPGTVHRADDRHVDDENVVVFCWKHWPTFGPIITDSAATFA